MEQPFTVIITIIALLLTILHNYQEPTLLSSEGTCNPQTNICVTCPQVANNTQIHTLNRYIRISHHRQFHVLSTTYNYHIVKKECTDMLSMISRNQKGGWTLTEQSIVQLQNKTFKFQSAEQISVATGIEFHLIVSGFEDYLIFYEGKDPKSPQIYVQNEANPEKLMKVSRSISWGMLFALLLKYFDSKFGVFNKVKFHPFPLIESISLSYLLYISYQPETFAFLYVAQLMFLTYLVFNLVKQINNLKIFCFFILFFILGQSFTFLANIVWLYFIKTIYPNLLNGSLKLKIITSIVIIGLLTNALLVIGKFNYFAYLSYAYKTIAIPTSFMLFQVEEAVDKQSKKRQQTLSRYAQQLATN